MPLGLATTRRVRPIAPDRSLSEPVPQRQRLAHSALLLSARVGVLATLPLITALGCESGPEQARVGSARATSGDGFAPWPFWTNQIRVHPLTRLVRGDDPNRGVLDLRVEAFDADGIDGRAVGVVTIELAGRSRLNADPGRHEWRLDLVDPAINRRTFDTVTRTYHGRYEIVWTTPPPDASSLELTVTLESADGRVLSSRVPLRWE